MEDARRTLIIGVGFLKTLLIYVHLSLQAWMSLTFSSMNRSNILSYHKNKEAGRACSRSACRGSSRFYMAVRMERPGWRMPSISVCGRQILKIPMIAFVLLSPRTHMMSGAATLLTAQTLSRNILASSSFGRPRSLNDLSNSNWLLSCYWYWSVI